MNIAPQARFPFVLMLTAFMAIATALAGSDQAATVQADSASSRTIPPVANDTYSNQASQQRIALLGGPAAAAQPQVDNWNNPQRALSSERQTPDAEDSSPEAGSIVLPVVSLYAHPKVIPRIGRGSIPLIH